MAVKSRTQRSAPRKSTRNSASKHRVAAKQRERASEVPVPELPPPNEFGNYPAREALAVIVAQQIIQRRRQAGWTQVELAAHAGLRQETVRRIESGAHAPVVTTVDKIDRALGKAGV